jgi:hypothetical protein
MWSASVSSSRSISHIRTTSSNSPKFEIQIQRSQLDPTVENREPSAKEVVLPIASSVSGTQLGLDWALFKITEPDMIDTIKPLNTGSLGDVVLPRRVVPSLVKEKDIVAVTGHSGILMGKISSSTTMMRLSPGSKFQEVWTVRLSGHIGISRCGLLQFTSNDEQAKGIRARGYLMLVAETCTVTSLQEFRAVRLLISFQLIRSLKISNARWEVRFT